MSEAVLIDTGPLVAILSESDGNHARCVNHLREIRGTLVTCWPVVTEAAWLLRAYPLKVRALLSSIAEGHFVLAALGASDAAAISTVLSKYSDLGIQLADAALIHLANRERIDTIFTLDRRDFGVMRLAHGRKVNVIP